jgi:hypothetical protein
VGGGWFFALRPYLHNTASTQLDQAMVNAVQQIPPTVALLPPGPVVVTENLLKNMIVGNLTPSDPIQNVQTQITQSGIRIDFQVLGQSCAISGVPVAVNGHLSATKVTVEGIIGLIMSPDELTALLNKHLSEAQGKIGHKVTNVQLKNHELDLRLG